MIAVYRWVTFKSVRVGTLRTPATKTTSWVAVCLLGFIPVFVNATACRYE